MSLFLKIFSFVLEYYLCWLFCNISVKKYEVNISETQIARKDYTWMSLLLIILTLKNGVCSPWKQTILSKASITYCTLSFDVN